MGYKPLSAQYTGQRGFIQLSPILWAAVAAGVAIVALSGALWVQSARLGTAKAELKLEKTAFASFQGEVKRLGVAANKYAAEQDAKGKADKEKADAKIADQYRELDAARRRLRVARADPGSSLVPRTSSDAPGPERITFDRADLDRALREYEAEVEELVGEGATAVIKLDGARRWAQGKE